MHEFLELSISNEIAFDVSLHLGTLLSVVLCFRKEIFLLIRSFILSLGGKKDEYSRTSWLIILATIPAGVLGFLFDDLIESKLHGDWSMMVTATMLIVVAILFLWVETREQKEQKFTSLNWRQSLFIGFAQALALIPGTSRSGITIIAGLRSGLKREEALKFSFLMSIPVILGASVTKIPALFEEGLGGDELLVLVLGFCSAFIVGILSINYFLKFARNNNLNFFAYYRIVLALILILYIFVY